MRLERKLFLEARMLDREHGHSTLFPRTLKRLLFFFFNTGFTAFVIIFI